MPGFVSYPNSATRRGVVPWIGETRCNECRPAKTSNVPGVIGKVTSIEDKTVTAIPSPGATNKVEYTIAVIEVSDALVAPKGQKTVRKKVVGRSKP